MRNAKMVMAAMAGAACLLFDAAHAADSDAAIARVRAEYDAAVQSHDVGLQNAKKIQLAVLLAKADSHAQKTALGVEMPPLAKELNCIACHAIDHKLVGPAWRDVANKYTGSGVTTFTFEGKTYPLIEGLVLKVSRGGVGNWGNIPMPANDPSGAKKAKITELLRFEQSLAKK